MKYLTALKHILNQHVMMRLWEYCASIAIGALVAVILTRIVG